MVILSTPALPGLRLREAVASDQENLRVWKNAHRTSFFFKDEITPEMQAAWFAKHEQRTDDVMLVVEERAEGGEFLPTGCMGYRLLEGKIDLYNILRGTRIEGAVHTMGDAFNLMNMWLTEAYRLPLTCSVIAANPARDWYEKLGMRVIGEGESPEPHVVYELDVSHLPEFDVKVETI